MFVNPRPLEQAVCADPDDDKFLAAALAAATGLVVSGDKHLLAVSGYCRLRILTPAEFLGKYGSEASREE
jgi:predicted nucleic acid-binding protein